MNKGILTVDEFDEAVTHQANPANCGHDLHGIPSAAGSSKWAPSPSRIRNGQVLIDKAISIVHEALLLFDLSWSHVDQPRFVITRDLQYVTLGQGADRQDGPVK